MNTRVRESPPGNGSGRSNLNHNSIPFDLSPGELHWRIRYGSRKRRPRAVGRSRGGSLKGAWGEVLVKFNKYPCYPSGTGDGRPFSYSETTLRCLYSSAGSPIGVYIVLPRIGLSVRYPLNIHGRKFVSRLPLSCVVHILRLLLCAILCHRNSVWRK